MSSLPLESCSRPRLGVLLLLSLLLLLANLWSFPIYIVDESRNAACAREMWAAGEWVVPTFNGLLRTDKPVLHYYPMMLFEGLLGTGPLAARLGGALMGVLLVLWVYVLGSRALDERSGWYAALLTLCSLQLYMQFHLAVPDPYLIALSAGAVGCFYGAMYWGGAYVWGMYLCLALATLAKGPVALLLPGLSFLLFLLLTRSLRWEVLLRRLHLPAGALLYLAVALPWYLLVGAQTEGAWPRGFFLEHNLSRFSDPMEGHGGGFWLVPLFVLVGMLPFSLFCWPALRLAWVSARRYPFLLLAGLYALVVVGFFSVSGTKLPTYPEPAYPFVALLLGFFLSRYVQGGGIPTYRGLWIAFGLLAWALPVAAFMALQLNPDPALHALRWQAAWLLLLPLGFHMAWWWLPRRREVAVLVPLAAYYLLGLGVFYGILPALADRLPLQQARELLQDKPLLAFRRYQQALPFALQRTFPVLQQPEQVQRHAARHPGTYVVTDLRDLPELPAGYREVWRAKDPLEGRTMVVLLYP